MRLQRLSMTAIGPFAERTELDLARFGDTGLFLIEGPTGSGKSTVLDAISFALYGRLAQSSATSERLKSHHAPPATEPVIELIFETQRGRYRIRRTPTHERPRTRGDGTTRANMTAKLFRLTDPDDLDGGELISNKLGEVEDEITRAVGLSHAQFVQTVLLPQGEFATFLRARTDDKRALLQRLFGTEVLHRTQQLLEDGRADAARLRAAAVESVRNAVHAFAGAAGLSDEAVAELAGCAEVGDRQALVQHLAVAADTLEFAVDQADDRLSTAAGARKQAEAILAGETELTRRRGLRDRLRTDRRQLLDQAEPHRLAREQLAAATRALAVQPAAAGLDSAVKELDAAQRTEAEARELLPESLRGKNESALRKLAGRHATLIGGLVPELRREQELDECRPQLVTLRAGCLEQHELIRLAGEQLSVVPQRRQALAGRQTEAEVAVRRLTDLRAERRRAVTRLAAAEQAAIAAAEAARERELAAELFEAAASAQRRFMVLQTQWRANIASELGLALQDGDPCAVCGSVEHPMPAAPSADGVSQEQLRRAETELGRLNTEVERRRQQLGEQQTALVQLQLAAEQLTPELARTTLDKVEATLAGVEEQAAELPAITDELAELAHQQDQLAEAIQLARTVEIQWDERAQQLAARIEQDEQLLAEARAGHPTVADRIATIQAGLDSIEAALEAAAATQRCLTTAEAAGATFTAALADAGFTDQDGWRHALLAAPVLAELRGRLEKYDAALQRVTHQLASEELTDPALDGDPAELTELAETLRLAELAETTAAQERGANQHRLDEAAALAGKLDRTVRLSARVLERTAPAIRLGNLVAGMGDNRLKMELTTYVLVRRFAEVLAAANTQLHRISRGRYQLEHTDARTGNAKAGLNLRVLDLHTGRPRDPATLSGGETFYVSLALALGLADVVRAESGGIDLGTLFIDEGFGTLDAEVLDEVITVLDSLRDGGRAVGIVSHVSELKMRFADRIKVERNLDGTSRLLVTA
jgi:DNA repair protein SbcC/Rad50